MERIDLRSQVIAVLKYVVVEVYLRKRVSTLP